MRGCPHPEEASVGFVDWLRLMVHRFVLDTWDDLQTAISRETRAAPFGYKCMFYQDTKKSTLPWVLVIAVKAD